VRSVVSFWLPVYFLFNSGTFGSSEWLVLGYLLVGLPCGTFIGILVGVTITLLGREAGVTVQYLWPRDCRDSHRRYVLGSLSFRKRIIGLYRYSTLATLCVRNTCVAIATGGMAGLVVGRQSSNIISPADGQEDESVENEEADLEKRAV
jgi:hypothetical protein